MSFIVTLMSFLQAWWHVDKVRVPRATGRLLQLYSGNRLLIRDEVFIVREKTFVTKSRPVADADLDTECAGVKYLLEVYSPTHFTTKYLHGLDGVPNSVPHYILSVLLPSEASRPPDLQLIIDHEAESLTDDQVTLLDYSS